MVSGLIKPSGKFSQAVDVAVLPPDCRPAGSLIFKLHANSHTPNTRVDVHPDGRVRLREGGGFNGWLSLSGIGLKPFSRVARVFSGQATVNTRVGALRSDVDLEPGV